MISKCTTGCPMVAPFRAESAASAVLAVANRSRARSGWTSTTVRAELLAGRPLPRAAAGGSGCCQDRAVLTIGVVVLGVADVRRAAEFWRAALGYELRDDGF